MQGVFSHYTKARKTLVRVLVLNFLFSLVASYLAFVFSNGHDPDGLARHFLHGLVYSNCIGLPMAAVMRVVWPWARSRRPGVKWPAMLGAITACCVLGCFSAQVILTAAGIMDAGRFWPIFGRSLRFSLLLTFVFGGFATAYESLRSELERTTLELRTKELERERALKVAMEARLSSLESRVHPHFLFNTLNSISSLIQEDPKRAERLVEQMAALLRYSLNSTGMGLVALRQELQIVRDYLEIEKARYEDRLRFELECPVEAEQYEVPPFSVQTLVENSIKYAVAPRREGGQIRVSVAMVDEHLRLIVADDGPGFGVDALEPGHGLDTLQSRLLTLFGMDAGLDFQKTAGGMSVIVQVPKRVSALARP